LEFWWPVSLLKVKILKPCNCYPKLLVLSVSRSEAACRISLTAWRLWWWWWWWCSVATL